MSAPAIPIRWDVFFQFPLSHVLCQLSHMNITLQGTLRSGPTTLIQGGSVRINFGFQPVCLPLCFERSIAVRNQVIWQQSYYVWLPVSSTRCDWNCGAVGLCSPTDTARMQRLLYNYAPLACWLRVTYFQVSFQHADLFILQYVRTRTSPTAPHFYFRLLSISASPFDRETNHHCRR